MKRAWFIPAFALAVSLSVCAQNNAMAAKKEVHIKPYPGTAQVTLDSWNDVGRKLIAMAEDFPEDKYDFKPKPEQRSFAEQLLHAAGANYYFTNLARGDKSKVDENPKYKSKADVVTLVKKSFADGAAAIKAKGDKGMSEIVVSPFAPEQTTIEDFANGIIEHDGEHYGQLVVYYRLAGLVPPESRPKK
ncbi:MAG TPA: DinB family protein [Candidatus Sulfotelmatobacter sp.]